MSLFLEFKMIRINSLIVVMVVGIILLTSSTLTTHASSIPFKVSARSKVTATSTSACGTWSVVPSPNPGTESNVLNSVTVLSANNAWAVGGYFNNTAPNPQQTLIVHWNGSIWSVVPSPNTGTETNVLNSVTAVSANNIWAVGYYNNISETLVEHWNGQSWSVVSSPNVGTNSNVLYAVAKVPNSSQLWAVGDYWDTNSTFQPLIEVWNDNSWSVVPNPNLGTTDNLLSGVTSLSAHNVWAVGVSNDISAGLEQTLTEKWNGTSWNVISSPNLGSNGYLHNVVRVPHSNKLWTVGDYNNTSTSYETLTEHWNGSKWKIVSSPNPSPIGPDTVVVLSGVTAISPNNVWAVGYYQYSNGGSAPQTLIENWNGISWVIVSSPNPGTGSILNEVARVPESSQLWAVGETEIYGVGYQSLIEYYC